MSAESASYLHTTGPNPSDGVTFGVRGRESREVDEDAIYDRWNEERDTDVSAAHKAAQRTKEKA